MMAWAIFNSQGVIHWTICPLREQALDTFWKQRTKDGPHLGWGSCNPFSWWEEESGKRGLTVQKVKISEVVEAKTHD